MCLSHMFTQNLHFNLNSTSELISSIQIQQFQMHSQINSDWCSTLQAGLSDTHIMHQHRCFKVHYLLRPFTQLFCTGYI